ncbi:MAG: TetR/AcrR family transcriptional regulator C-terminal domain-containing protein [Geminicoccaceae bacterium]|jgi:TetR/AcrR family transcriptional repressor of mexJK operon
MRSIWVNVSVSEIPPAGAAPRRGRPLDPGRRAAILAAARALLFSGDAAAFTMEAVALRARVSKATLYRHFPDLAALARAVVVAEREAMTAALEESPEQAAAGPRERLEAFGRRLVAFIASPGHLRLHRALAAHAGLRSWMGPLIWAEGIRATHHRLAELLASAGHPEPEAAAEALIGTWQGSWHLGVLLDARPPPEPAEQAAIVRRGLALVLDGPGAMSRPLRDG